ncbi:MAG: hypothetical protein JHC85_15400 [Chthoniobacterales bacterium]|nr:hypothetical protein [Chthoniobacterales bacterium]
MSEATPTPQDPTKRQRRRTQASPLSWCLGGGLFAAVALFFAAEAWLNSYLGGEAFRGKTEAALGRVLKAEARLAPLERQGTTLASEALQLHGGPAASFGSAELSGIRAEVDLSGLWQRLWRIQHLGFQRLHLDLNKAALPIGAVGADRDATIGAPPAAGPSTPSAPRGFLAALLPNRARIETLHTDRASVSLAGAELRQSRLTAHPAEADAGWDAVLESGELSAPGLPALELQEARVALRPGGEFYVAAGCW